MEGHKCNAFGEKGVAAQRIYSPFFEGECKHIKLYPKRASKALHSRILNPIFVQSEVVIPKMQNGKKYVLRCNGFMAPKCVTGIAVAVFLVCAKIFIKMMQYPAQNDVMISEGPFKTDKEVFGWMIRK